MRLSESVRRALLPASVASAMIAGCGDDASPASKEPTDPPETYAFQSRFEAGVSSVGYAGQTMRHVLLLALTAEIEGLTEAIEGGDIAPENEGDVVALLDTYFRFDSDVNGGLALPALTATPALQATFDDLDSGKNIVTKLAGNDTATEHKDWSAEFSGWSDESIAANGGAVTSPEQLVVAFFKTLEKNALDHQDGVERLDPLGDALPVHVTANGLDLAELTEKFTIMALTYSQGADDYLDDGTAESGILADNSKPDGETDAPKPYTKLEHAWDEGFGYFGAARDFALYTDEEIAKSGGREEWQGAHDTDSDGKIDLASECNFNPAVYTAKRDVGSVVATDFTGDAFRAFVAGRHLISEANGALSDEELAELKTIRDQALAAWESAIAATVVHYINDVLEQMNYFGTNVYSFGDHAAAWSEMKGFALGFQFNPRSQLSDGDFAMLHALMGDEPTLSTAEEADIEAYAEALLAARALLADTYDFADENLGDETGGNGW